MADSNRRLPRAVTDARQDLAELRNSPSRAALLRLKADIWIAASSNASSNADVRNRTASDQRASKCLLRPKGRTDSDDSGRGWACLLIRGSTAGPPGERLGPLWDHTLCMWPDNQHVGTRSTRSPLPR